MNLSHEKTLFYTREIRHTVCNPAQTSALSQAASCWYRSIEKKSKRLKPDSGSFSLLLSAVKLHQPGRLTKWVPVERAPVENKPVDASCVFSWPLENDSQFAWWGQSLKLTLWNKNRISSSVIIPSSGTGDTTPHLQIHFWWHRGHKWREMGLCNRTIEHGVGANGRAA